mmetsp:Transcript_2329/g.5356  ORF Transcript_2329/g.5356 Transcript_2329/m.5356 type:complete len:497 (-) Transcript_2329:1454-2944(-)
MSLGTVGVAEGASVLRTDSDRLEPGPALLGAVRVHGPVAVQAATLYKTGPAARTHDAVGVRRDACFLGSLCLLRLRGLCNALLVTPTVDVVLANTDDSALDLPLFAGNALDPLIGDAPVALVPILFLESLALEFPYSVKGKLHEIHPLLLLLSVVPHLLFRLELLHHALVRLGTINNRIKLLFPDRPRAAITPPGQNRLCTASKHLFDFSVGERFLLSSRLRIIPQDQLIECKLLLCPVKDTLLDSVPGDELVHRDLLRLSDAMRPVVCLLVPSWVPIRIYHDHSVSPRKRDTQGSSSRGEKIGSHSRLGVVEERNLVLAAPERGTAVQAEKPGALHAEVVLNHIKHRGELRVNKHLAPLRMQALKQTVENLHLGTRCDDPLIRDTLILFTSRKEVRMVAALAKLHQEALQLPPPCVGPILVHAANQLLCLTRVDQKLLVPETLHVAQGAPHDKRFLVRKVRLYIALEPAKHERLKKPVRCLHEVKVHSSRLADDL